MLLLRLVDVSLFHGSNSTPDPVDPSQVEEPVARLDLPHRALLLLLGPHRYRRRVEGVIAGEHPLNIDSMLHLTRYQQHGSKVRTVRR